MYNWEAIGAIGEILGAIAVVATLAYLAVQIRESRTATAADIYQTRAATRADSHFHHFREREKRKVSLARNRSVVQPAF